MTICGSIHIFDAFSSREPVFTSLENAMRKIQNAPGRKSGPDAFREGLLPYNSVEAFCNSVEAFWLPVFSLRMMLSETRSPLFRIMLQAAGLAVKASKPCLRADTGSGRSRTARAGA